MKSSFPSEQINQENEALLNITQKLADIRKNLGIEDQDDLSEIGLMQQSYKTPSDDSNQFEVDHNTFGKQISNQQTEQLSLQAIGSVQKENLQQNSRQITSKLQSQQKIIEDQQKKTTEQIIILDEQIHPPPKIQESDLQFHIVEEKYKQNIAELQQKNTQLQMDLIYYSELLEYNKLQCKQIEKKFSTQLKQLILENELLIEKNTQLEQKNKILIGNQKLPQKIQEYVENLEIQLTETQKELNSFANKYTKEITELEIVKEEKKNIEKNIKKELESHYKEEIRDLKFILEKWTSKEQMIRAIKKSKPQSTNLHLGETRKSQIEKENQKLRKQLDVLKDKLKTLESTQKQNQSSLLTEETLQAIFQRRIENYKNILKKYHQKFNQIQDFFNSTIRSFQKDLNQTKQQMLDNQNKVYFTFENLITSIYEEFGIKNEIIKNIISQGERNPIGHGRTSQKVNQRLSERNSTVKISNQKL